MLRDSCSLVLTWSPSRMGVAVASNNGELKEKELPLFLTPSCFSGEENSLCPVSDLEFAEDIRHMVAHGFQTEHQSGRDFLVGMPLHHGVQDFSFPIGQIGKNRRWHGLWARRGKEIDQALGYRRTENSL